MDWLWQNLLYSEGAPLDFMRLFFWGFFLVILTVFSFIYPYRALRNTFLFFVSLYFYYKTAGVFCLLLLFTIAVDFSFGLWMDRLRQKWKRVALLCTSLVLNLGLLFYFKYTELFTDTFNQIFHSHVGIFNVFAWLFNETGLTHGWDVGVIILPVGISFYTFQSISYIVDVYRREIRPVRNILDYGFFVSFFPQLVAGPIVRAHDFIPQMYRKYSLTRQEFGIALFWILNGAMKKALLANYIADNLNDRVFAHPTLYSGFEHVLALFGYSMQVYGDFSGYTDIAIGVALLMGFTLRTNFNSPYKARNPGEFWKRWHMSLSSWLKDYLYIPLGGSRRASLFTWIATLGFLTAGFLLSGSYQWIYLGVVGFLAAAALFVSFRNRKNYQEVVGYLNTMLTMLLGGMWHGPTWLFLIWGGLNGVGIVLHRLWSKINPFSKTAWWAVALSVPLTFTFITFTRIFFRAPDMKTAEDIILQLRTRMDWSLAPNILIGYYKVVLVFVVGIVIHWLPVRWKEKYRQTFAEAPIWVQLLLTVLAVLFIYQVVNASHQRFIYFQF